MSCRNRGKLAVFSIERVVFPGSRGPFFDRTAALSSLPCPPLSASRGRDGNPLEGACHYGSFIAPRLTAAYLNSRGNRKGDTQTLARDAYTM